MAGAGAALNWNVAESKIDRFNKPLQPMGAQTYGFKGFPDGHMFEPKRPLRHQPSADVTTDVNRYFRKDSPPEWLSRQEHQQRRDSPPRQPSPPRQHSPPREKMRSPPPQFQGTLSPRYNNEPQSTRRKEPVIRDPLGELSFHERQKKIEEHYQAEEDLAMAQRRREEQKMAKIEEQRRVREMQQGFHPYGLPGGGAPTADNRKMKFTEHQMNRPSSPKYDSPRPRFGDENRGIDGVRSSMEQRRDMNGGKEDFGRATTMPLRPYSDSNFQRRNEMLEEQAKQLKHVQSELSRNHEQFKENPHLLRPAGKPTQPLIELKAQDDMNYPSARGMPDYNARAQSEPQTDRPYRTNRDRYFGESEQRVPDYLGVSPRRRPADRIPVGQFYNKESTYKKDFDLPTIRHGQRNLGNPNQEAMEPYSPFGLEGGGAPLVDPSGQRKTRIVGSMGKLGVELSYSAKARGARGHKKELLDSISEQAARDRERKEQEKQYRRQEFTELSDVMRQQKVGYPKYNRYGLIDNHPLNHMFEPNPTKKPGEQRELYDFLTKQVNEKYMHDQLGTMEGRRQAIEHYKTQDRFFGRRGGGNIKGDDLRKVNLDRAIHNPTSTSRYYNKVRLEDEFSPPEILDKFKPRITINSTHKNLYEFPEGNLKMNYQGRPPYAEGF